MLNFQKPPLPCYLSSSQPLGVWVSKKFASHVGLTYHLDNDTYLLHLSGNNRLLQEPITWETTKKEYVADFVDMPAITAEFIAEYAHTLFDQLTQPLSFGIDWTNNRGSFDKDGAYTPPSQNPGFTCATFIEALFNGVGFPPVDFQTWPKDEPEDLEWKNNMLTGLEKNNSVSSDVIDNVKATNPVQRLRPAQLAATLSTSFKQWPLPYTDAKPLGASLESFYAAEFQKT